MKPLSQNAIGRALGLSSAMMVKMRKNGCPMDSVEAVANWRRRNIMPTMQSMLKKGWKDEPVNLRLLDDAAMDAMSKQLDAALLVLGDGLP